MKMKNSIPLMLLALVMAAGCTVVQRAPAPPVRYDRPAPVGYHPYWYYPYAQVYYRIDTHIYYYRNGSRWAKSHRLPDHIMASIGPYVPLSLATRTPYRHHSRHLREYPPHQYRKHAMAPAPVMTKHPAKHHYWYFPESNTYYNPKANIYYYQKGNKWHRSSRLPKEFRGTGSRKVELDMATDRPHIFNQKHRGKYKIQNRQSNRTYHEGPEKVAATKEKGPKRKTVVAKKRYLYYPDQKVYFQPGTKVYYYNKGGKWTKTRRLPLNIRVRGQKAVQIETQEDTPYKMHRFHSRDYPAGPSQKQDSKRVNFKQMSN